MVSGEINTTLTLGGAVNIIGSRIKIAGDSETNGLSLVNQSNGEESKIPLSTIAINEPSKVVFVMPTDLSAGDYKIRITTQFSNSSTLLKTPRSYDCDVVLAVG